MNDKLSPATGLTTVVGLFTETWDADAALEDLRFAGYERILSFRHRENDLPDDTRSFGGLPVDYARDQGIIGSEPESDSAGRFSVNPETEDYFQENQSLCLHVVAALIEDEAKEQVLATLTRHHGRIELRHAGFFEELEQDGLEILDPRLRQARRIHPTQAILPPKDKELSL